MQAETKTQSLIMVKLTMTEEEAQILRDSLSIVVDEVAVPSTPEAKKIINAVIGAIPINIPKGVCCHEKAGMDPVFRTPVFDGSSTAIERPNWKPSDLRGDRG